MHWIRNKTRHRSNIMSGKEIVSVELFNVITYLYYIGKHYTRGEYAYDNNII